MNTPSSSATPVITERLLHFIWQFQYFNKGNLRTLSNEQIQVIFPGQYNKNQGPDFSNAKVKIGNTLWAGTIEIHIRASDWRKHKHHHDDNYGNVILHVVWENDSEDHQLPVIELKDRVSKILLHRYNELMNANTFIPCGKMVHQVSDITWKTWKTRLLAERLTRKASVVLQYLEQNNYHWEETFWWLLARSFGMKVNADAFESLARSIPLNILAKNKNQVQQIECLLMGQAGLLNENFKDDYPRLLQKEYQFQKNKYSLHPIHEAVFFLRMRPVNFPTIRLAQLAMLVHTSAHLFSKIKETVSVNDVKQYFNLSASDYWHTHYRFDEVAAFKTKALGGVMADTIIINTICPVLFAYGHYHGEQLCKDKALEWLSQTDAEKNSVVKGFQALGIENKTAYDSQALLELKNEYCVRKRCLDCSAGNALLKM